MISAEHPPSFGDLLQGSAIASGVENLRGRSVRIASADPFLVALALIEFHGLLHTLVSLAGAIVASESHLKVIWNTFYDIRRYGGLQIYLLPVLTHSSLLLTGPQELVANFPSTSDKALPFVLHRKARPHGVSNTPICRVPASIHRFPTVHHSWGNFMQGEQEEAERKRLLEEKQKAEEEAIAKDPLNPLRRREAGEKVKLKLPADVVMAFAWCPDGSFRMGGTVHNDEQPIHKATLTKGFYMGIYPVTQAQWKAVMSTDPSQFKGANRPVESVTWHECNEFCTKLGVHLKGRVTIRLPSEAEWEYACRAGTTTEYHFGNVINTDLANYDGNYSFNDSLKGKCRKETTDVGLFPANSWGLYDVHGNVWEWCRDAKRAYSAADHTDEDGQSNDDTRVLRGGSWRYSPGYCRAAYRSRNAPAYRGCNCGFRVCFRLDCFHENAVQYLP